jgi:LDH2 family malate/lactate/ureidoglycolate dehydrogenase
VTGAAKALNHALGLETVDDGTRYRVDDLRRFASALAAAAGLTPARAAALVAHLLWFDTAGAARFGLATLPDWLDRLEQGSVKPNAEGKVVSEHAGTAFFDGQAGLPPLVLARAAGLASEKARDVGVAIVRVTGLGPTGPAAPVAAEMAIGPEVSFILGPRPSWTLALPSAEGLPAVFDSLLADHAAVEPPGELRAILAPWSLMAFEEGWLVVGVAVTALEPLASFQERVSSALKNRDEAPGQLLPGPWNQRRSDAREHGLAIGPAALAELERCAERLGVALPTSWAH